MLYHHLHWPFAVNPLQNWDSYLAPHDITFNSIDSQAWSNPLLFAVPFGTSGITGHLVQRSTIYRAYLTIATVRFN
jgi:hypothetical protein